MASLNIKTFIQFVEDQGAAIQAATTELIDFTVGSILRATAQASGGVAIWLESLVVYVLTLKWAATSSGEDLDSWMNDFGLIRLGASPSTGLQTFGRLTTTSLAYIPVGGTVKTNDQAQQFNIIADPLNPNFDAVNNRYVIPVGVAEIAVPVKGFLPPAATNGSVTNVAAGAIGLVTSSMPGIDYTFNAGAFTNGVDAETDEEFRTRFPNFLLSLSKATAAAVRYAVQSLQLAMQVQVVEFHGYDGIQRYGYFYVVFDDGSGAPPAELVSTVYGAVDAVRAQGVMIGVFAARQNQVTVEARITAQPGYDITSVRGAVGAALQQFVNSLPLGSGLPYTRIAQVCYAASAGVANVSGVKINGLTADIPADPRLTIKSTSIIVD